MKKALFTIMLLIGMGTAHAANPLVPVALGTFGLGIIAMNDGAKGIPACYYEEDRLVKWVDQPGYSFYVAGCDYQAKKDRLVVQ